ncbi:MAG: methylated-DNA--[protein]-cysteine S-methyltransferase [Alphaproteobacteria bacterium]|jgi:AraC family transcriptional regulator of adaptative response/methylated-DNA-[protein]-cysteine methyltransferase|nr:methylated-DNA--[protein]-cysteine S-methyltransferase [Alphaproteobacteria bacterium]MDP7222959.1 methylated-DNA--[protein]-cysteine S-methyltransferase [Alphaproteobacteria bacterium]
MDEHIRDIIAQSIDFLVTAEQPVRLSDAAAHAGYSETHFQKLFTSYVGISPKRFQQYLRARKAEDLLLRQYPTLEAAYDAGLSGNGRLHDVCVSVTGMTPGHLQRRAAGVTIYYGTYASPVGHIFIGQTEKGICWLGFAGAENDPEEAMRNRWPAANFIADAAYVAMAGKEIEKFLQKQDARITLDLYGTNFQINVWKALLQIPQGGAVSYSDIAAHLGKPSASRAVGSAVGQNPISLLIPCHRVIQKSGIVENYAWGSSRKRALLGFECDASMETGSER